MASRLRSGLVCFLASATAWVHGLSWTRAADRGFGGDVDVLSGCAAVALTGLALGVLLAKGWGRRAGSRGHALRGLAFVALAAAAFVALGAVLLAAVEPRMLAAGQSPVLRWLLLVACLPVAAGLGACAWLGALAAPPGEDSVAGPGSLLALIALGAAAGCAFFAWVVLPFLGLAPGVALAAMALAAAAAWAMASFPQPESEGAVRAVEGAPVLPPVIGVGCFAVCGFVAVSHGLALRIPLGLLPGSGLAQGLVTLAAVWLGLGLGLGATALLGRPGRGNAAGRASQASWARLGASLHLVLGVWLAWLAAAGSGASAGIAAVLVAGIPAMLLGAAFAVWLRVAPRAGAGASTLAGCAGGIAAVLAAAFLTPELDLGARWFAVVVLDLGLAALVLLWVHATAAARSRGAVSARGVRGLEPAAAVAMLLLVSLGYGGVSIERALPGDLAHRTGAASVWSLSDGPDARVLRLDGEPVTSLGLAPPYLPAPDFFAAIAPYLFSRQPERALLLGLDGGVPLAALLESAIPAIEVAEHGARVASLVPLLHEGGPDPLANRRAHLSSHPLARALGDAGREGGVDVLVSTPRHPWRSRDAGRLEGGFFALARSGLRQGGVLASALPLHRMDPASVREIVAGFEGALPGALVLDVSLAGDGSALLLLGSTEPMGVDAGELARRMGEPVLARALARYGVTRAEDLIARIEGPAALLVSDAPSPAGVLELRAGRNAPGSRLSGADLTSLPATAALLPDLVGALDWSALADAVAAGGRPGKLERLLADPRARLGATEPALLRARLALADPGREPKAREALEALADAHPQDVAALRMLALHHATRLGQFERAAELFERAFQRSGASQDAYDAARAWDRIDEARAYRWIQRIAEGDRADHPRIAWFEAKAALREGRRGPELMPLVVALSQFRRSPEGRKLAGVAEVLAALSEAAGQGGLAAIHAEAHRLEQERQVAPLLAHARAALDDVRMEDAIRAMAEAARIWPGSPGLLELRVRVAAAAGDAPATDQALRVLRAYAPGPEQAIAQENALRRELGLDLLPRFDAEEILAAGNGRGPLPRATRPAAHSGE